MEEQLFQACLDGKVEEVQKFLNSSQIDINCQNIYGQTSFCIACDFGHVEIVKLLLNDERVDISLANNADATPFYFACFFGHLEIVEYILISGREVNLNSKFNGKTIINITREVENIVRSSWETIERFQKRKQNCLKIVELLESFERNPNETRFKLKLKLGEVGKLKLLFLSN